MYKYIKAMTFNKKTAIRKMSGFDQVFTEHFSKIILYGELMPEYVDGWFSDIGKAIYNMSRTAVHSDLKEKDYFKYCFDDFGDCTQDDSAATLDYYIRHLSRKSINPYPEIEYTEDQAYKLSNVLSLFRQELSKFLSDSDNVISIQEGKDFSKYIFDLCS